MQRSLLTGYLVSAAGFEPATHDLQRPQDLGPAAYSRSLTVTANPGDAGEDW